jgi:superkiller protein 3
VQLQKPDSAVYFYKKAIELKNNLPGFYVNLGMAYLNIPDFNRAIETFNKALAIDSNFYTAHIGKGAVFDYRSEPDLAEAEYRKVIKLEPNNGIGYKKLGLILINKNDYENAITISNKALELLPSDDDVENMVSLAYFKYGNYLYLQSKYREAITNLEKAVEYTPNNSNPKIALAWAYYKQAHVEMSRNNSAAGISQLENAVKIFPEFVEANYNLGIIYLQQNNAAEAYKYIKQVYTLNPKYQQVATIYEKLKEGQP